MINNKPNINMSGYYGCLFPWDKEGIKVRKMENRNSESFLVPLGAEVVKMTVSCEKTKAEREILNCRGDAQIFLDRIRIAMNNGKAHISSLKGIEKSPEDPVLCGWRGLIGLSGLVWYPQGELIGWIYGNDLYLDMDTTCEVTNEVATESKSYQPSKRKLINMIKKQGRIASSEPGRNLARIRALWWRHVLHIRADDLFPELKPENHHEKIDYEDGAGGLGALFG